MTVEVVLFDAGLTLLAPMPSMEEALVAAIVDAGAAAPEPLEDRRVLGDVWRRHDEGWQAAGHPSPHLGDRDVEERYWTQLYTGILDALGVAGDLSVLGAAVAGRFGAPGTFRPFPDVDDALTDLHARGVAVGLVSNWGTGLRDILAAEHLLERFDAVAISGEVGAVKPDQRLFAAALDELGVPAGPSVAHVGDDVDADVAAATELGLRAVLIDRFGWSRESGAATPVDGDGRPIPVIDDLASLAEVLPLPDRVAP